MLGEKRRRETEGEGGGSWRMIAGRREEGGGEEVKGSGKTES